MTGLGCAFPDIRRPVSGPSGVARSGPGALAAPRAQATQPHAATAQDPRGRCATESGETRHLLAHGIRPEVKVGSGAAAQAAPRGRPGGEVVTARQQEVGRSRGAGNRHDRAKGGGPRRGRRAGARAGRNAGRAGADGDGPHQYLSDPCPRCRWALPPRRRRPPQAPANLPRTASDSEATRHVTRANQAHARVHPRRSVPGGARV